MRIAVYSGTFDPVHTGHAMVASYIAQFGPVDAVWMVVSPLNPFKVGATPPASNADRLEMTRLAMLPAGGVEVSDIEFGLGLPSYSYRTLCALRESHPDHEFVLVIGSDNWPDFNRWYEWQKIIDEFGLLIYPRPGYPIDGEALPANVTFLKDAPQMQVSSSFVRSALAEGRDMHFFIPEVVIEYIDTKKLYSR